MPTWLKVLITVLVIIVLLVVAGIGAGVFWWMRNKDGLRASAKQAVAEGKAFGAQTDNQGCAQEGAARYKKAPGFFNSLSIQGFVQACLDASRPTPGFCDNIPSGHFMEMQEWQSAQCKRYEIESNRDCQMLVMPIVEYCGEKNRGGG